MCRAKGWKAKGAESRCRRMIWVEGWQWWRNGKDTRVGLAKDKDRNLRELGE